MLKHSSNVPIDPEDLKLLRGECRRIFLAAHPELSHIHFGDRLMLKNVIRYYIEN